MCLSRIRGQRFLLDLNERCTNGDAEYAERTKMRNTELAAVSEAIAMLADDSARDLFSSDTRNSNAERWIHWSGQLPCVSGRPVVVEVEVSTVFGASDQFRAVGR